MDRYAIALNKIPKKPVKVSSPRRPVVTKKKSGNYMMAVMYRSTFNSLLRATKEYEAGEVVMAGSEPVGICTNSNTGVELYGVGRQLITYCHGAGTVISTNRVDDSMEYALGDKLYSVEGLLTKKVPIDSITVVGVVIGINGGEIMIQMRI
jgi:hypothetical protein